MNKAHWYDRLNSQDEYNDYKIYTITPIPYYYKRR